MRLTLKSAQQASPKLPNSAKKSNKLRLVISICILFGLLLGNTNLIEADTTTPKIKPANPKSSIIDRIQKPFTGDLDAIRKRRIIRVLVSRTKTNFFLTSKGFRGLEHDLLVAYESYLNRGLRKQRYETHLTFIPLPFSEILTKLQQGYGDIAASGLTITPERQKLVDFTKPYITNVEEILISNKHAPPIKRLQDLAGKQVIVVGDSSYIIHLEKLNQTLGVMGRPPIEIVRAAPLLEAEDLLELVNEGIYDYTVVDSHIGEIWSKVLGNIQLHPDFVLYHNGQIAWAIQKNHPKLKASLDRFIQVYAKPGRFLGNAVYKKYFEDTYWIKRPLTHDLLKKVRCLQYYFELYAEYYGFDWRLIAALAYQESRFNQSKKSHMGAIGIMQIKPSTARDKNVDIHHINKLENNIEAGVKYLAFLRERYFSDPQYSPEDRDNFALAAYNAGPARILQLQEDAQKHGLNPYKWFYNVETLARNEIGRETVNYVTSIQKMKLFLTASKRLEENKRLLLEKTSQSNLDVNPLPKKKVIKKKPGDKP
ncbi:lytic transglycosylase F [Hydrogenovibrio sp. JE_KL2]|uniref:transglycosylase SLT domain-containing protein n=1 Tax=Hydrogenovibrio sp. JE_KL2 TaxID=2651188 RepID=UPI00128B9BAF|nr:lytic transglycosylase F [Hydrogenovibrio sp. JE_KL2]MPQ77051.1 lytic transglycosylase F [Hydrogenovibrio sp. JE_KL2]